MGRDVMLLLALAACTPSDDFAACTAGDGGPEAISACSRIVLVAKIPLLGLQFDDRDLAQVYMARGGRLR